MYSRIHFSFQKLFFRKELSNGAFGNSVSQLIAEILPKITLQLLVQEITHSQTSVSI